MAGLYRAQMTFGHPAANPGRFRYGEVYWLDDDAEEALAGMIAKERLLAIDEHGDRLPAVAPEVPIVASPVVFTEAVESTEAIEFAALGAPDPEA